MLNLESCSFLCMLLNVPTAASRAQWRSEAYAHFDISIRRDTTPDGLPSRITYVFTCKTDPEHKAHVRPRAKSSEGTSNLLGGIELCLARKGVVASSSKSVSRVETITYSPAAHRALIALRCAKRHRPFNFILDEEYLLEVQMLRPGTIVPHPITVSRDIRTIYIEMSKHVRRYFRVSSCPTFEY